MGKKMTSGEIAKKVGISQKTVRLYDEKGLLKPTDYSEGNYRLYDNEAILVLEKIIALKQIGFSLEEIYENLIIGKNMDIVESLHQQLDIMERKKQDIEKTIACIKGMLARTEGQPDWNDVAEVARTIQQDQEADQRHFEALKHTPIARDWYELIFDFIDDINSFIIRVANTLKDEGRFSVNGVEVRAEHSFWKGIFVELGLKTGFLDEKLQSGQKQVEQFRELLQKHFKSVKIVTLDNSMRYDNAEEILERLRQQYPENRKYMEENENLIRQYFEEILNAEGAVIVDNTSTFWHCVKEGVDNYAICN